MRHIFTYLILLIGIAYAYAVPIYEYDTPAAQGFQSHKVINTGTIYQGTTYAPFDDAAPSEYSEVGQSHSPNKAPGGPRRAFDTGGEYGRADEYPIGEPWILAIFAVGFGIVIAIKRQRRAGLGEFPW